MDAFENLAATAEAVPFQNGFKLTHFRVTQSIDPTSGKVL